MGGLERPKFVLFGSSIVQLSYINEGWGAALAHIYARKADIVLRGYSGWNSRRAVQVLDQVFPKADIVLRGYSGWNSRRAVQVLDQVFPKADIVLRGYSGWNSRRAVQVLDQVFPKADIVLRGYSGWNSRRAVQVLDQVFPKDAAIQPSLVIVYFGGNDSVHPHATGLGPHVPLPEYIENTRKIAMHLKSISDKTRVIFLSAPPASEEQIGIHLRGKMDMVRTNEYCRIYSEACLEVCREMNLKAVDLWTAIQQVDNWETVCLKDGIHFAPEGSRMIVKEILRVIKEAQWEPSLYWKAMPTEFSEDSPYDPVGVEGKTVNVSEPDLFGDFPWE